MKIRLHRLGSLGSFARGPFYHAGASFWRQRGILV